MRVMIQVFGDEDDQEWNWDDDWEFIPRIGEEVCLQLGDDEDVKEYCLVYRIGHHPPADEGDDWMVHVVCSTKSQPHSQGDGS